MGKVSAVGSIVITIVAANIGALERKDSTVSGSKTDRPGGEGDGDGVDNAKRTGRPSTQQAQMNELKIVVGAGWLISITSSCRPAIRPWSDPILHLHPAREKAPPRASRKYKAYSHR